MKLSLSAGCTCPNRDGTIAAGGCSFCSEGGSGDFAAPFAPVKEQIRQAKKLVDPKFPKTMPAEERKYIAYFQSFTSTYCSAGYLENVLSEASSCEGIEAVSVATRPDCLGPEILEVLSRQAKKMPLFVELGLQTSSDATAEFINRCYKTEEYTEAVKALKEIGANVITHIIFGLPGETKDMMMDTVRTSVDAGSDGYKFTCLYVLENTYLEKLWRENQVEILEMEEYFDIVEEAVRLLPEDAVVHRFTGDGPKKILLAPEWTKNKRQVVNYINRRFGL